MRDACRKEDEIAAAAQKTAGMPLSPWTEQVLTSTTRADGRRWLSPDLLGAVERGSHLGTCAHPNSALGRLVKDAQVTLDQARSPDCLEEHVARQRLESDGFRFCAGGELTYDPALVVDPPKAAQNIPARSLTPGRREWNPLASPYRKKLRNNLLAAVSGLMEAPFNRDRLRKAEIATIVSRLVDLDLSGLGAVKTMAEFEVSDANDAAQATSDLASRFAYTTQAEDALAVIEAIEVELAKRVNTQPSTV